MSIKTFQHVYSANVLYSVDFRNWFDKEQRRREKAIFNRKLCAEA